MEQKEVYFVPDEAELRPCFETGRRFADSLKETPSQPFGGPSATVNGEAV